MPIQPKGTARKKTAPKPAPEPKQEPKSLISNLRPEKSVARGEDGSGYSSATSGEHHGAISALADAVGFHGAQLTEGGMSVGMSSSHKQGMADLNKVYNHLAEHAKNHKLGEHSIAAGHLNKSAVSLNEALTRFGSSRGTIRNAYGETIQAHNIERTTNYLVNSYAQKHNVKIPKTVNDSEQYRGVPSKEEEKAAEQKRKEQKYYQPRGKAPMTKSEVVKLENTGRRDRDLGNN